MARSSFGEAERAGWTARAQSYDADFVLITNQAIPHVLGAIGALAGRRLLDVCCGPGHLAGAAAAGGAEAVGVDFAPTMIERARRHHPAVPFLVGDAEHLPHADAHFDAVACVFGVMHLPNPDLAMAEARRVLRPAGILAFTQWAADDELLRIVADAVSAHGDPRVEMPPAPPLLRFSDPEECRRTLQAHGFEEITVSRVALVWKGTRPDGVLDLIYGGAVRAAMLIEAQRPADRDRIHGAILGAIGQRRTSDGGYVVRRPAVLATGLKPLAPRPR